MINNINITIGSDPEFVIMCGDKVENALEIFTRLQKPDYCCECPHPSPEDIKNIYDYGGIEKTLVSDAMRHSSTYYLAPLYPLVKATAIMQFYEQYNYNLVDVYEGVKQEHLKKSAKVIKNITDVYYVETLLQKKGIEFDEIDDEYEQIVIIKRLIRKFLDIKNWYDVLEVEEQKAYDDILQDEIMQYYENILYPELNDLPDEIKENVIEKIINDYETDCSACDMKKSYFCSTELGCDGQLIIGEMRPKPGNNPVEHFSEILKLMEELNDMLAPEIICYGDEQLQVKAGAAQSDYQLGGHIHIGSDKHLPIQYLGKYLSFFCGIPLTLLTDTNPLTETLSYSERDIRHSPGDYGSYGNYRAKPYGIEFRMPSSWLVSPQITIGALSLAYVVSYESVFNVIKGIEFIWEKMFEDKYKLHPAKYIDWYKNQNWILLQGEFEPIKLEIQKMELYSKYKEYIDYIFDMIEQNETWESDENILPKWAELW